MVCHWSHPRRTLRDPGWRVEQRRVGNLRRHRRHECPEGTFCGGPGDASACKGVLLRTVGEGETPQHQTALGPSGHTCVWRGSAENAWRRECRGYSDPPHREIRVEIRRPADGAITFSWVIPDLAECWGIQCWFEGLGEARWPAWGAGIAVASVHLACVQAPPQLAEVCLRPAPAPVQSARI